MKQLAKAQQISETDVATMVFARLNNEKRMATDMAGSAPKFRMTKKQWRVRSPRDNARPSGPFSRLSGLMAMPSETHGNA